MYMPPVLLPTDNCCNSPYWKWSAVDRWRPTHPFRPLQPAVLIAPILAGSGVSTSSCSRTETMSDGPKEGLRCLDEC